MPSGTGRLRDRMRSSLFLVPMLCVVGGIVLGQLLLLVDGWFVDLDDRLGATVESARTVLTTVAGATLAFAGVAFSVSLLVISMASNQYSPRVVHGLFRDPFNKRVMGLVIGTFTYCLVVLRAVRSPAEEGVAPVVPSASILMALVLGIGSVLAIVGFINHSAHSMDASYILHRVSREALEQARAAWPEAAPDAPARETAPRRFPDPGVRPALLVRADNDGWVQRVDHDAILTALPPGGTGFLQASAGQYAIRGAVLCELAGDLGGRDDEVADAVRQAVVVGRTRTLDQDVSHGVRQLVDVALRGLSPGVNDPTTAHEALCQAASVLGELLRRTPPAPVARGDDGRELWLAAVTHQQLVDIAFDEVRLAAADDPTTLVRILDLIGQLLTALEERDRPDAVAALRRQARLVRELGEGASVPEADRAVVRDAWARRFGGG